MGQDRPKSNTRLLSATQKSTYLYWRHNLKYTVNKALN